MPMRVERAQPTSEAINHERALEAAREAVALACRVTRSVQSRIEKIGEITKDDKSPVTIADFAAQAVVAHHLHAALPSKDGKLHMVGEESTALLREPDRADVRRAVVDAVREVWKEATEEDVLSAFDAGDHDASASSYWTLDPIDGTKGFLRREQYALALALIERGEVVLGVMGCPNLSNDFGRSFNDPDTEGLIFVAMRCEGASVVSAVENRAVPRAVNVGSDSHARDVEGRIRVCESVETGHTQQDDTARIIEHLGGGGTPARLDSQCKYAVVARGQADAYLRLPTKKGYVEKIWDHAAGMIIAQEAGAIVTDIDGKALDFSRGSTLSANQGVICANPRWHAKIIDAMEQLGIIAQAL